ncbi:MAG: aa3-type cytochrome c oxidase subunit IV [Pseudomonadota bacterium]
MADPNGEDDKKEHGEQHVAGTMNIEVQERTFENFLSYVGRGMAVCIIALILLYLING